MDDIYQLTKLSAPERDQLVRGYSRITELERLSIHKEQTNILRKRKRPTEMPMHEYSYACLLIALDARQNLLSAPGRKRPITNDQAAQLSQVRREAIIGKRGRRREGKNTKLIRIKFFQIIKSLREDGFSWREISDYLAKNHKHRISHTYLHKIYNQLKEAKDFRRALK